MTIGSLVAVPELQAEGLARLNEIRGGFSVISFLASGASMTQESRLVLRYALLPDTRVQATINGAAVAGTITSRRLSNDKPSGLLVYGLRLADGSEVALREDQVTAVTLPEDPVEQLATAQFNDLRPVYAKAGSAMPPEPWSAQTLAAREELLTWRDAAWALTGGVVGLAAARVIPLPHQLLVARRALDDRQVRFLLADEVGLGKTIEAGLIIQSLLAIKPTLRVLVIVPGALISQWFLELHVRFGGQNYLMLDNERLRTYPGNPWEGEQFVLASSRAVEELSGKGALRLATSRWDVVVVDECHRMQPGGALFNRVAVLSKASPHVLLLSATPARQHADAYLALLTLLQPQVWGLGDSTAFASRLAAHDQVVALLAQTLAASPDGLAGIAKAWVALLPGDRLLAERAAAMAADPHRREALLAYVREHLQLDRRVIRNRRQVLARLAAESGIAAIAPTTRSRTFVTYTPDPAEKAVRAAHALYRKTLVAAAAGAVPPRLAHWLTQVELALSAHPVVIERMLAMRAAVLASPGDFVSYQARVPRGETLAQVLRSDLSENEIASHVAISAACHADPKVEHEVLTDLRGAVAAWHKQKAGKPTARMAALIARLTMFWADHPQEKVLIFTTHGLAVKPLAALLMHEFGETAVETFGAHQETIAREEAVRRFQSDDRCPLLVCDPLGGEGRNFQFVSVVVHHDLPWSLAAVEQRIGRVDRLGRDGDIPSWIVAPDAADAVDAAWGELLDTAVGVFSASTSGLEFISDAIESMALAAALADGGKGVRKIIPAARKLIDAERDARDRREDDCFHADAATYSEAGRGSEAVNAAEAPSGAVMRWIRGMGGEVRREEEAPHAWRLRTRHLDTPLLGVFDRATALLNPQLAFLGIGNQLIDRLIDDAAGSRWCRASAWRRTAATGTKPWSGVRAVFCLVPDFMPLVAAGLRLEVLRRLFVAAPPLRLIVCATSDGVIETDPAILAQLAEPFSAKAGDTPLSRGINRERWTRPLLGGHVELVTTWQAEVRRAGAAVLAHSAARLGADRANLRTALDARLTPGLEATLATAASATARLGDTHAEAKRSAGEAAEEQRQVTALRGAVDGASFDLESIAYIALG
jgi:ATP-dependent helicase HepA